MKLGKILIQVTAISPALVDARRMLRFGRIGTDQRRGGYGYGYGGNNQGGGQGCRGFRVGPGCQGYQSGQEQEGQQATPQESIPAISPEPEPGDLNIRFSKFTFSYAPDEELILGYNDYPMQDADLIDALKRDSTAISLTTPSDYDCLGENITEYIELIGGHPAHPVANEAAPYWAELEEVVNVQLMRTTYADSPASLLSEVVVFPELWSHMTIAEVAEAVHDEYPGLHQANLLTSMFTSPEGLAIDTSSDPENPGLLPFRSQYDFVGLQVRVAEFNTWATAAVAPLNFLMKWTVGRARPEEVAYKISTGELTTQDGVPQDLVFKILGMDLSSATDFTHYPEGSPRHPSFPAMHSAASSLSLWLPVIADLTDEQYCQALRTDYAVSYARTVAGVHYGTDNLAGLNLGQEIIARKLPDILVSRYGANRAAVEEKIAKFRFDWNDFDPTSCPTVPQ